MPRDGSGVYSPPSGTTAVSTTTIASAAYNAWVADLTALANEARPVSAGGTGQTSIAGVQGAFRIPPYDGAATISGAWNISGNWTFTGPLGLRVLTIPAVVTDNATDNAAIIQAALTAAYNAGGGEVRLPPGRMVVGSTITVPEGVTLSGSGRGNATSPRFVTRLVSNHNNDIIDLDGNRSVVANMTITHSGTPTGGRAVVASNIADAEMRALYIVGTYRGIECNGCNTPRMSNIELINMRGDFGIRITGTSGNVTDSFLCLDVSGGFVSATPASGYKHFIADNYANSGKIIGFRFVQGDYGVVLEGATDDPDDIWISGGGCDNQNIEGLRLETGQNVFLTDVWIGQAGERGVVAASTFTGNLSAKGLRVRGSGQHGIELAGGGVIHMTGCLVGQNGTSTSNTYSGLRISGATDKVTIHGGIFGALEAGGSNQQQYGIVCVGTCDKIRIIGVDLEGNLTRGFANSSSGTDILVQDCIGHITENFGQSALVWSGSSVSFAHGLSVTPTYVSATLAGSAQDDRFVVDVTADATNITLSIFDTGSAALLTSGTHTVNWVAKAKA